MADAKSASSFYANYPYGFGRKYVIIYGGIDLRGRSCFAEGRLQLLALSPENLGESVSELMWLASHTKPPDSETDTFRQQRVNTLRSSARLLALWPSADGGASLGPRMQHCKWWTLCSSLPVPSFLEPVSGPLERAISRPRRRSSACPAIVLTPRVFNARGKGL
jgi:hypothetical protein